MENIPGNGQPAGADAPSGSSRDNNDCVLPVSSSHRLTTLSSGNEGNATTPEQSFRTDVKGSSEALIPDTDVTRPSFARSKPSATAPEPESQAQSAPKHNDPLSDDAAQSESDSKSGGSNSRPPRLGGRFNPGEFFGGKYEILGHIGQGGMGVVYRARDAILDRVVAIKFLKARTGVGALEMSRFHLEAKAIASLDHNNIIRVHDMSVTADGDPFFVLEYLDGCSLSHELRTHKKLPLGRALQLMLEICDALQHAHSKGVVHRDIKPSNIMLVKNATGGDTVKLLDFGIAKLHSADDDTILKLTKTGELFGSPHYMSPEQCSGQKVDRTTDIYSVGCVFFEMLTGGPPFMGATPFETLDMHKSASPPSVLVKSPELAKFAPAIDSRLAKMLSKKTSDRYPSAQELAEELLLLQKKLAKKPEAPNKHKILLAVSVLAFAGIVTSLVLWAQNKAPQPVPIDKTPWATYDLKGQQLFDRGAYERAEKCFLKALNKAKTEKSNIRLQHMNTTLRELRMIYYTMENRKGFDWATEELLNVILPPFKAPYTWKELFEMADLLKHRSTKTVENEFVDAVALVTFSNSDRELPTKEALPTLIQKLSNNEMLASQIRVMEGVFYVDQGEFPPLESQSALKFIQSRPDQLSVRMKGLAVRLAFSQKRLDLNSCERMLRSVKIDPNSVDSILATVRLSKIDWSLDKKGLAVAEISESLAAAERVTPRNYTLIADALFTLASYDRPANSAAVLPLLVRAKAIAECEHFGTEAEIASSRELIVRGLVDVLVELGRLSEAEAALKSVLARYTNSDSKNSLSRPTVLAELGYIYLLRKMYAQAEECLLESIAAFEIKADSLPLSCQEPYASSLHNLSEAYKYEGKQALSEQYAIRAKRARLTFQRNLPTAQH
ncbi:MAG: protein kinase [Candidatus Obscuribacterales bacterium]|nr:protein kinase [Candidatus Obscuribacterales bacterium]